MSDPSPEAERLMAEYLAAGLSVVTPAVGQLAERLSDGVDAIVVPPHDVNALAAALRRLCDDPEEVSDVYERLIKEMGTARAARRLGLRFNLDRDPTRAELEGGVRRSGLSIVRIFPVPADDARRVQRGGQPSP